jgi:hypothetical protein
MQLVDFPFMPEQSAAIGESLQLLAATSVTFIWSVMFVHMFTPFALPFEGKTGALFELANHLVLCIPRRIFGTFVSMPSSW